MENSRRSEERSRHSVSPDYQKNSEDKRRKHGKDHYRDREDRSHRLSRSPSYHRSERSHRRSRSPSYHRGDKLYKRSRSPSYHRSDRSRKSRSRSRERGRHSYRHHHSPDRRRRDHHERPLDPSDRKPNKLSVLEKLGIELKLPKADKDGSDLSLPSYYNPMVMNPAKYAEQVAKRKLLWGNSQKQKQPGAESEENTVKKTESVWQGARFSQDQDGKLTAKFQRLMGIKKDSEMPGQSSGSSQVAQGKDLLKKQEELFSSMELQYEAARQATHTQRGVGLGFGAHHYTPK